MLRGFLDYKLTPTTPIPDPPSQHDTAPIPCPHKPKHPLHSSPRGIALNRHPSRSGAKAFVCVWGKFTHPESIHKHTHTHSRSRATPAATYLCYITHATAYPSTARSALHSATDGDASPQLLHCRSKTLLCLEGSYQTRGPVLWAAADSKRPMFVLTVQTEISARWTFPQTWHLTIHEGKCGQRIESGPLIVPKLSLASPLTVGSYLLKALLAWRDHRKFCFIV